MKLFAPTIVALLLTTNPAWAAQEVDHSQHHPAAPAAGSSPMDKMEKKMAKAELALDRLTQKMAKVKETLAQAQQATGDARKTLLASHGEALGEVLQGLREATLNMMSKEKMAGMMDPGKAPGGEKDMAKGGMMAGMDMEEHHRTMEKRLILLFDLMEQMLAHGKVAGTP